MGSPFDSTTALKTAIFPLVVSLSSCAPAGNFLLTGKLHDPASTSTVPKPAESTPTPAPGAATPASAAPLTEKVHATRTVVANEGMETVVERDSNVRDYYNETDRFAVTATQRRDAARAQSGADRDRRAAQAYDGNIYRFTFSNVGGLVMPVILKMTYSDGSDEIVRIPAEVWRRNSQRATWQWTSDKTLVSAEVDPLWETADSNRNNNGFPQSIRPTQVPLAPAGPQGDNRMRSDDRQVTPDSIRPRPAAQ